MLPWTGLITVLTLLLYLFITINVGRARAKYKVLPKTGGLKPCHFDRLSALPRRTAFAVL